MDHGFVGGYRDRTCCPKVVKNNQKRVVGIVMVAVVLVIVV